ncbi:CAP domain-containing protein [Paraburkholderia phymatum]|uniref:SCP-like extracellular domain protein n=1 Tax=Paraburkholderia phymatum (strain DSM 17167 / CIP 108236 / LMG 21445 / STM815) TaxID=391038 RepID=B2JWR7_PARP8|nr:CAP domain-containing protein [Paraburkholderia phymatum]ACC75394.1 SCP-like extracellular domain protein [Paraburkholderia phymatum STM815]
MHNPALAACCLAITLLTGCTNKAARIDRAEPIYSGPPVQLRRAPGSSNAVPTDHKTALDYVNARREEAGLPLIAVDGKLAAAAADHARYLELNRVATHDEVPGKPGFTGTAIMTRVRRHTAADGVSEILAVSGEPRSVGASIEAIFSSPYHRGAILFDWARAGEASIGGARAVTVVDFADIAPALADTELVAWPYDGQREVPTAWVNNEQPDPMGTDARYRGQVLGFPITLSGGPNAHIDLRSVDLRDQRGRKVACKIAPLTAADAARNTAICTPYEPLRTATRYTVRVIGEVAQPGKVRPFDLAWAFTTREDERPAPPVVAQSGNQ